MLPVQLGDIVLENMAVSHPGLTAFQAGQYAGAARVSIGQYSEETDRCCVESRLDGNAESLDLDVIWSPPTSTEIANYGSGIDGTEHGAYGMCLAAVEQRLGLVSLGRAPDASGADFILADVASARDRLESRDQECCVRLEVSGVGFGSTAIANRRLQRKKDQVKRGLQLRQTALAAVCAFQVNLILIERIPSP